MLQTELYSVQPQVDLKSHSQSRRTSLKPLTEPAEAVMETLTHEMENMIIENKLRKEVPLRSTWDAAISRGLARERAGERGRAVTMMGNGNALPYPVSLPGDKPRAVAEALVGTGLEMGVRYESPGRLPSPRPSPPPPPGIIRRGSSYMRARSVSC
jgi:hypothetical protein